MVDVQYAYIHAVYESPKMGYIDDVEFVFVADGKVELRSNARLGYYDFKVNRQRIDAIRKRFSINTG